MHFPCDMPSQLNDSDQIFKNLKDILRSDKGLLPQTVFDMLHQGYFVGDRHWNTYVEMNKELQENHTELYTLYYHRSI